MIRRFVWSIVLLLLLSVVANAQVVKCSYESSYHQTDTYTCEDNTKRRYTRNNLIKEPSPHKVMYACYDHQPTGFAFAWTAFSSRDDEKLFVTKPTKLCNDLLNLVKKDGAADENRNVAMYAKRCFFDFIGSVMNYADSAWDDWHGDKIDLAWSKIDMQSSRYENTYKYKSWYWKEKKRREYSFSCKEPKEGHGVTIELNDDLANTGCKKGTKATFLIDDDYRLVIPSGMKKQACFDSISGGLLSGSAYGGFFGSPIYKTVNSYGVLDDLPYLVKNGDARLKIALEELAARKKADAEREAAEARFMKAWAEAKKKPSDDRIEHLFKLCYGGMEKKCNTSLSKIMNKENFFIYEDNVSSEQFDMGTIDLGDVQNKRLEFTIVMNWDELNNWNDKNYWDEEKWGSKDTRGECKDKMGGIDIVVDFASRSKVTGFQKTNPLPVNNYFVENENSHPWIKKVSIPLDDFTNKTSESFDWSRVESFSFSVAYPGSARDCNGLKLDLFSLLGKNFYDITNIAIVNTAPVKEVLDIDPASCFFDNKGAFEKGVVNINNTYICSDSGWSLYSVKIGNVEVAAHNSDVGGKTFTYDNMYFEEKNQREAWNRYSRTWGHLYEKSELQNVCPDGWRLPNEYDLKEIKQQIDSKQAGFPYVNYSYTNNNDEYGCVDMYGQRVRKDTSLCEMASSMTYFSNNTYIIPDGDKRLKYKYVHPNLYWAMGKDGEAFVYGADNFRKRDKNTSFVDDVNFIRCVKSDNNPADASIPEKKVAAPSANAHSYGNLQRKNIQKSQSQNQEEENLKQKSANTAAESAKQDDAKSSMSTTKVLRIGVFSAVAIGGGIVAYVFDKKAKDATAIPPTNEQEFKKGHDDAVRNQNVRNISLGVAAAGLVALSLSILF